MKDAWEVYRLVNKDPGLLDRIERWWSCDDVLDVNDSLDYECDVEIWARGPIPPPQPRTPRG